MSELDYKTILLQFIGSLTLCDHMGDVSNDVVQVLERIGLNIEWDDWPDLGRELARMGITTLYGTSLGSEPNEMEEGGR
jgi:hypothetical protein